MSEDRADRLSKRRRERTDPKSNARKTGNTENTDNTSNTTNTENTGKSANASEQDEETVGPLRETAETQMMRLTNEQYRELHHVYNRLKADYEYEFDEEFELNRHFFPLVLDHALDELRDQEAQELRQELKEMD